jgi:hypothetical protein
VLFLGLGAFAATQFIANIAEFPVYVNGELFQAKTGMILAIEDRTYLPVRDMSDALGIAINWNEELRQVEVGAPPEERNENAEIVDAKYLKIFTDLLNRREEETRFAIHPIVPEDDAFMQAKMYAGFELKEYESDPSYASTVVWLKEMKQAWADYTAERSK